MMAPEYGVINNESRNIKHRIIKFGSGLLIFYKKDTVSYVKGSEVFLKFPNSMSTLTEKIFGQKGVLYADFITDSWTRINVANTHLASLDHDGTIRFNQVDWIKEQLRGKNLNNKIDLQIIGGDLSAHKVYPDGTLQSPLVLMEEDSSGGFPMKNIFENFPRKEEATYNKENLLVELSKWPLSTDKFLDYLFYHSSSGKCPEVLNAEIALNEKYPLYSLTEFMVERKEQRELDIEIIKAADPVILEGLKKLRIRNGDNVWKWKSTAQQYDPDGSLRRAIDDLYKFETIEDKDLSDYGNMIFDFEKESDDYLSPLSDHYGVYGEVTCGGIRLNF